MVKYFGFNEQHKIENEPKTEKEIENLPPWICSFNYGSVVAVKCQAVQK